MRALVFVLLMAQAACATNSPTGPAGPVNAQLVLAPGGTAQIAGTSLQLRFHGVIGDSRCPADAVCIQGGDALVRIEVIPASAPSATYDLHTGSLQPIRHEDVTITLVDLSPYPFSSRTIAPSDHRA